MRLIYSQIDRKILELLAGGQSFRQNVLVHDFSRTGTAPEYVHTRIRSLEAMGLITRDRPGDKKGIWLTITESGRGALKLMETAGAV